MKGIVFTELMDMIDQVFGEKVMDDVLGECNLASGGAYTAAGFYDHRELTEIVGVLSRKTGLPVQDLTYKYGYYLFERFSVMMPQFFEIPKDAFDFLESLDQHIHVEVKKLYPDAELPHFFAVRSGDRMVLTYQSKRPFSDFASGLIGWCIKHFGGGIGIQTQDRNTETYFIRDFTLTRHA